jgi:hypothetical protein
VPVGSIKNLPDDGQDILNSPSTHFSVFKGFFSRYESVRYP